MASGSPDLFVVCKHCGSEVSPYITECPYCGHRLQKRAPKLNRDGKPAEVRKPRPSPTLPRLRRGEIPGIRHDNHPYATGVLVALGFLGALLVRTGWIPVFDLLAYAPLNPHWWRIFTSPFIYGNTWYTVLTLATIALFGTLLERRHGPFLVLALFLIGAALGTALGVEASPGDLVDGANGAALALVCAWAMPDVLAAVGRNEFDGDLIGAAVVGAVIALMPLAAPEASWAADGVGVAAGILIGYPVARLHPV